MRTSLLWFVVFVWVAGCGGSAGTGDGGVDAGDGGPLPPVCGDGVVEGDEQCDDGNTDDGDGCDAECFDETAVCGDDEVGGREECDGEEGCLPPGHVDECRWPRTAFRFKHLELLDPGLYGSFVGAGNTAPAAVNPALIESVSYDVSPFANTLLGGTLVQDGLIDLGFVLTFANLDQSDGAQMDGSFVLSDCNSLADTPPVPNPSPCAPTVAQEPFEASFEVTTQFSGTCLGPVPDSTGPVAADPPPHRALPVPTVDAGDSGCWVTNPFEFSVMLGTVVTFPLSDTRIAAQWDANPASNVVNGLIRGFIDEATAESIMLPDLTVIGPASLAATFTAQHRDDNGPNGETGFWVYLSFEAETVPWKGGLMCGDGDIDVERPLGEELCDPAISSGEEGVCTNLDACAASLCTDVVAGDPCATSCVFHDFSQQKSDDCCIVQDFPDQPPVGAIQDVDCQNLCGDGTVQGFEDCDIGIDSGMPGACDDPEVFCDDGDPCTKDSPPFFLNECVCFHPAITDADDGSDGCCPPGSPAEDPNCT